MYSRRRILTSETRMTYTVYILECADKTFYTGLTNNLEDRLKRHNSGRGAKYTKYRCPVSVIYMEEFETLKEAMHREREIKTYTRQEKLNLINNLWEKVMHGSDLEVRLKKY